MKKFLLLLLFIPLVSFGQWYNSEEFILQYGVATSEKRQDDGESMYLGKDPDGLDTWNIARNMYNGEDLISKLEVYFLGKLSEELTFKGRYAFTTDRDPQTGRAIKKGTFYEKIIDGWGKKYNGRSKWTSRVTPQLKKEICLEHFFICNNLVYKNPKYADCGGDPYNGIVSRWSAGVNYKIDEFDLDFMINVFLDDLINNNIERGSPIALIKSFGGILKKTDPSKRPAIKATFVQLEGDALALSFGFNDDKNIILKVDPEKWAKASSAKRWYTLYHELGHDVLNYEHGQGGKMMFNFAEREYTWDMFNEDRNYMFDKYLSN